jgi:hypothetical protein
MNRVADAVIAGLLLAFTLASMIIVAAAISFDSPVRCSKGVSRRTLQAAI